MNPDTAHTELRKLADAGNSLYVEVPRVLLQSALDRPATTPTAEKARQQLAKALQLGTGDVAAPRSLVRQAFPIASAVTDAEIESNRSRKSRS